MSVGWCDQELVELDTVAVVTASEALHEHGERLRHVAGALHRGVPAVPEDRYGLPQLFLAFDDARQRFDQRLATTVGGAGGRLWIEVVHATDADRFVGFPLAAR
jgi:hypothetical protein